MGLRTGGRFTVTVHLKHYIIRKLCMHALLFSAVYTDSVLFSALYAKIPYDLSFTYKGDNPPSPLKVYGSAHPVEERQPKTKVFLTVKLAAARLARTPFSRAVKCVRLP